MIFTLTLLSDLVSKTSDRGSTYQDRDCRTVGYYLKEADALNYIINHSHDLQEHRYIYIVLEAVSEGVYPMCNRALPEKWFSWNKEKRAFEPSDKPDDLAKVYGFSMG